MRALVKDKLNVATDGIKSLCAPGTEASAVPLCTGGLQLVWGSLGAVSAPCLVSQDNLWRCWCSTLRY